MVLFLRERKVSRPLAFSISSRWQPCQLSNSRVCLLEWLMSDGSQICACALFPCNVGHREHLPICCFLRSTLSVSIRRSLCTTRTLTIYLSSLFMSSGVPSIIPCRLLDLPFCVCTAPGWRCLKALSPTCLSDVIIWWHLCYFRARRILFFVSLVAHKKRRSPFHDNSPTFHPSFSQRGLRDHTQTDGLSLSPAAAH